MNSLGIKINELNFESSLEKARHFLFSDRQYKIFTPNPEMLVKAQKDEYFKKVLNEGDLNLCDGFGLRVFSGAPRVPGVDFMVALCRLAAGEGKSIFLLGSGDDEVVEKCADELMKKFPDLKIIGYDKGVEMIEKNNSLEFKENHQTMIEKIQEAKPDILFVAFGMGKQEKWIHENLLKLPTVKIAMGVGGSFDFVSGKTKRAPSFLRKIGLEWIWRLIKEPRRMKRIFNATIVFTFYSLKQKKYD